jgi:hypothetical protein
VKAGRRPLWTLGDAVPIARALCPASTRKAAQLLKLLGVRTRARAARRHGGVDALVRRRARGATVPEAPGSSENWR